jgi:hypothetical protein
MPPAKAKPRSRTHPRSVARNVAAARDKILDGVSSSLDAVLLTRKSIGDVIDDAVRRGRMTRNDAQELMQSLIQHGSRVTSDIVSDVERLIGRSGDDIAPSKGSGGLPIAGYDDLSAAKVAERLLGLTPAQLRKVRDYERRHANRKTVLDPIERRLR